MQIQGVPRAPHVPKTSTAWWLSLPLWKMMEFVSWDDDIPNIWKIKTSWNHQPVKNLKEFDGKLMQNGEIGKVSPVTLWWTNIAIENGHL